MHIHILGICGTFMGGIALLAREMGIQVSGSDANVYPPMSTQLEAASITLCEGYQPQHLEPAPDLVVIGNALSRGNPAVEHVLNRGLAYTSGPAFLAEHILQQRWVLGVSGTHGKTSTSSMLAWILEHAGLQPGFLVGGVPQNFGLSARLGKSPFFVVEADEYDSAFFDKRSKFIHYRPRTLIMNNLEYDHADIFPDIDAIKRQFHHLVRTIPGNGLIIAPSQDAQLHDVLTMGCWTPTEFIGDDSGWQAQLEVDDGSRFLVSFQGTPQGTVDWPLMGEHNISNALTAIAAARHAGVRPTDAIAALGEFKNVKRRMELRGVVDDIHVYDDFAHHPTAIATTLDGLRRRVGQARIIAVMEPRSNTFRMGVHQQELVPALATADITILHHPDNLGWDLTALAKQIGPQAHALSSVESIIDLICELVRPGDHILIMSNGGFANIHQRLLDQLATKPTARVMQQ
jgi:UDP-N-acetylmuramate: L-alanyl-gamma-D-glutamyl-meso-diaminopimelate ligase